MRGVGNARLLAHARATVPRAWLGDGRARWGARRKPGVVCVRHGGARRSACRSCRTASGPAGGQGGSVGSWPPHCAVSCSAGRVASDAHVVGDRLSGAPAVPVNERVLYRCWPRLIEGSYELLAAAVSPNRRPTPHPGARRHRVDWPKAEARDAARFPLPRQRAEGRRSSVLLR